MDWFESESEGEEESTVGISFSSLDLNSSPARSYSDSRVSGSDGSSSEYGTDDDDNEDAEEEADVRPACKYGSGCYRKNADHIKQFYHPSVAKSPTKPVVKKPAVCSFLQNGWCHKYDHIKQTRSDHPAKLIRCPSLDATDKSGKFVGCTAASCKYQHPNPKNLAHQAHWAADTPKKKKDNSHYLCVVPDMVGNLCLLFLSDGNCPNLNCSSQHILKQPKLPVAAAAGASPTPVVAKVVPASPDAIHYATRIWQRQVSANCTQTVISVEEVISPQLLTAYKQRRKEMEKNGYDPDEILGFHGTSVAAIQQITQGGFLSSQQINNVYGKGTYFARDPHVSVSYSTSKGSQKMLLCRLLLGKDNVDSIWASSCNYYIIPDTRGCLPTHIITFK